MTGSARGRVVVVGSANVDLVASTPHLPAPGETVLGTALATHPGGKGLNQAVAAARDGARTEFAGAVGDDANADLLRAALTDAGIGVAGLRTVEGPSGTAMISVDEAGSNTIVVVPGANAAVGPGALPELASADVVLLQLEIPLPSVRAAALGAARSGAVVVLNAAPAAELDDDLLGAVDHLVVNEGEAAVLAGRGADSGPADDPAASASALLRRVPSVVVTIGGAGALALSRTAEQLRVPAPDVDVVDTTGAGDTFAGVFAAALADGSSVPNAVRRAVAAGALSVTRTGAVPSIPTRDQTDSALAAGGTGDDEAVAGTGTRGGGS